jgi:hypothetical protein
MRIAGRDVDAAAPRLVGGRAGPARLSVEAGGGGGRVGQPVGHHVVEEALLAEGRGQGALVEVAPVMELFEDPGREAGRRIGEPAGQCLAESYRLWVDPSLDGTEASLGSPLFPRTGLNALAGSLTNIGVAFSGSGGTLDAIRLSNDADGLLDVASPAASVPALSQSGLGLLGLLLSLAAAYGISRRE